MGAALGAAGRLFDSRWLVIAGFAVVAVGAATRVLIAVSKTRLEGEQERAELDRRLLTAVASVGEIDPTTIGVDPAAQTILAGGEVPSYVRRTIDEALQKSIRDAFAGTGRWLIVVHGPSKVGKSRTLYEALLECATETDVELVAPANGEAVRSFLIPGQAPRARARRTVLWLDDLERFVNEGVTWQTLSEWRRRSEATTIVAATYGGKGSDLVGDAASSAFATIAREILQQAEPIPLARSAPSETNILRNDLPEAILESIEEHGLAAYLVAARALELKLSTRRHAAGEPESPEGEAVVRAAADWARCGRTDSITRGVLRNLWEDYLPPGVPPTDEVFARALAWAFRPVAGTIALVQLLEGVRAYDYVVSLMSRDPEAPPRDAAWSAAVETAEDAQALAVATAAFVRRRLDDAVSALARASESDVDEVAAIALFNKGVTLGQLGRDEDALAAYEEVLARFGEAPEPPLREQVASALVNTGVTLGRLGRDEDELAAHEEVLARFGEAPEPALREQVAKALFNTGVTLGRLGRDEDELAAYEEVLARFGEAPEPALREQVARALFNTGVTLGQLGRDAEELAAYEEVLARFGEAPEPALREQVASALVNTGVTLGRLGRDEDALAAYEEVLARFGEVPEPALREQVAKALFNTGVTLGRLGRDEDELAAYEEVLARFGESAEPALREQVGKTLVNKGVRLGRLGRDEDELAAYEEVLARFGEAPEPALREQVASALFNTGVTLGRLGRSEDELAAYEEVLARFGEAPEPALREQVASALGNKGVTLNRLGRDEDALAAYEEVLARFGEAPEPALREQVAKALYNKAVTLSRLGRDEDALAVYEEVTARFGEAPEPALREAVAKALFNKAVTLGRLGRSEDALAAYDEVDARFAHAAEPVVHEIATRASAAKARLTATEDG